MARAQAAPRVAPLRERLREATQTAILAAAEEVLAERGVAATGMAEIAARAGVAVGTLYRYFTDKDELLRVLIEARTAELVARVDDALAASKHGAFAERLTAFARAIFEHHHVHRALRSVIFESGLVPTCNAQNPGESLRQRAETIVRAGIKGGELDPADAAFYPSFVVGMIKGVLMHEPRGGAAQPKARAAALARVFLSGARRGG